MDYNNLQALSIHELLKLRFYTLHGKSSNRYNKIRDNIENILCDRTDYFNVDELIHLRDDLFTYKNRTISNKLSDLYNTLVRKFKDHQYRYRFVYDKALSYDNMVYEISLWLTGKEHCILDINTLTANIADMITRASSNQLIIIADGLIKRKSSMSGMLLSNSLLPNKYVKPIMKLASSFNVIAVPITIDDLKEIPLRRRLRLLTAIHFYYQWKNANINITLDDVKVLVAPLALKYPKDVDSIIKLWSK